MAPAPDDAVLIRRIRAGDQEALNALLVAHYDRLYAICRRMTGNDPDALDATQDALMAIVAGLDRYDGRSSFRTWAYRVTTNACLDQLRRIRRRPTSPLEHDPGPTRAPAPGLDQAVSDRLVLDEALASLPPAFRAAVVLRDVIGLDYAEIAAVLDLPPGTVRSRIARGRRALAEQLEGNRVVQPDVEGGTP